MHNKSLVKRLTLGGLMIALVFVSTYSIKIPVPFTQGYIHGGDSMIFIAAILLGWKQGALAGGIGSALADLFGGYGHWALPTLIIKTIMGALVGLIATKNSRASHILAMLTGGIWMIVGYYFGAVILYNSFIIPLYSIPWNIVQLILGLIIAYLILLGFNKANKS